MYQNILNDMIQIHGKWDTTGTKFNACKYVHAWLIYIKIKVVITLYILHEDVPKLPKDLAVSMKLLCKHESNKKGYFFIPILLILGQFSRKFQRIIFN